MAKLLDFNLFEQPTLPVVLRDAKRTRINITAPSEGLIEKLEANKADIIKVCKSGSTGAQLDATYSLVADLMSSNEEGIKLTAEELKTTYGVNYTMIAAFVVAYTNFIDEIKSAKN